MIITTSLRENETLIARAQELASELGADYQPRRKLSLSKCLERFGPFYLLYKDRLSFVNSDASELTFHPDTAALRIKAPHDEKEEAGIWSDGYGTDVPVWYR